MPTEVAAPPSPPRAIPVAPTAHEWRALSLDQRARLLDDILDALAEAQAEAHAEQTAARAERAVAGLRAGVVAALGTRGIAVTDEQRARVDACEDPALLQGWLLRALTATNAEEVFSAAPGA